MKRIDGIARTGASSSNRGRRRAPWPLRLATLVLGTALPWLLAGSAAGSGHGDSGGGHGAAEGGHDAGHGGGHGGHGAAAIPYDPTLPRTFELGEIYLRNFRPTHNAMANIRFNVHVVFPPGTSDAEIAAIERWKRRLRDQAITAARSAEADDLAEPGLHRVQRLMLLRLQRLPLPKPVTGVYLTDFAVGSG